MTCRMGRGVGEGSCSPGNDEVWVSVISLFACILEVKLRQCLLLLSFFLDCCSLEKGSNDHFRRDEDVMAV
jgi:hypothetical protein